VVVTNDVTIKMPSDAAVLTVQEKDGEVFIWALVDARPEPTLVDRRFVVVSTGQPFDHFTHDTLKYVATFQIKEDLSLVFHLFERLGGT
jgi:hypothetical protein